jgi:hypothetical protein
MKMYELLADLATDVSMRSGLYVDGIVFGKVWDIEGLMLLVPYQAEELR